MKRTKSRWMGVAHLGRPRRTGRAPLLASSSLAPCCAGSAPACYYLHENKTDSVSANYKRNSSTMRALPYASSLCRWSITSALAAYGICSPAAFKKVPSESAWYVDATFTTLTGTPLASPVCSRTGVNSSVSKKCPK